MKSPTHTLTPPFPVLDGAECVRAAAKGPQALIAHLAQYPHDPITLKWIAISERRVGCIKDPFNMLVDSGVYLAIDYDRWDLVQEMLPVIFKHSDWFEVWDYFVSHAAHNNLEDHHPDLIFLMCQALPAEHSEQAWASMEQWFGKDAWTDAAWNREETQDNYAFVEKTFHEAQRERIMQHTPESNSPSPLKKILP